MNINFLISKPPVNHQMCPGIKTKHLEKVKLITRNTVGALPLITIRNWLVICCIISQVNYLLFLTDDMNISCFQVHSKI